MRHFYAYIGGIFMKTTLLLIASLICLSPMSFGQTILTDRNKHDTETWLKSDFRKFKYELKKTDTTYDLVTADTIWRPVRVHCSFDKQGKCRVQKMSFDCDSCYRRIFKDFLDRKRFDWKLVGPDRYLSKISRKLLLVGNTAGHYFTLSMVDVTDEEYKKMLNEKK